MSNMSPMSTAFSGMQAAQAGMLITSQNVSGASMEGYSRRRAEVVMSQFTSGAGGLSGALFSVEGFGRDFSSLVEKQRGVQYGRLSQYQTMSEGAATLDAVVMDSASSIGNALDKFFASAGTLARDENSISYKTQFLANARQLVDRFNGMRDAVRFAQQSAEFGLKEAAANATRLASQLASVNGKIVENTGNSGQGVSPDLLDRRDQLVIALQQEVGGQAVITDNGTVNVYVDGSVIVNGNQAGRLSYNPGGGTDTVYLALGDGGDVTGASLSMGGNGAGKLKGYLKLLQDFIPGLEERINTMSSRLTTDVNAQFAAGSEVFTVDAATGAFDVRAGLEPSGLTITPTQARAIEALREDKVVAGKLVESPITLWAAFTTHVGADVANWKADYQAALTVSQRLDQEKERISGVNLDEEAANLLKFQQLYGATSKVLQIGSQMFDQLISILR